MLEWWNNLAKMLKGGELALDKHPLPPRNSSITRCRVMLQKLASASSRVPVLCPWPRLLTVKLSIQEYEWYASPS